MKEEHQTCNIAKKILILQYCFKQILSQRLPDNNTLIHSITHIEDK